MDKMLTKLSNTGVTGYTTHFEHEHVLKSCKASLDLT